MHVQQNSKGNHLMGIDKKRMGGHCLYHIDVTPTSNLITILHFKKIKSEKFWLKH